MRLHRLFTKCTNLREHLVHIGCWVNAGHYSSYTKAWLLGSTCPTLHSIDEEMGSEFGRHWFQKQMPPLLLIDSLSAGWLGDRICH